MKPRRLPSIPRARSIIKPGFSLIEAILAVSIFALLVTAFVGTYIYGKESTALAGARARANLLAEEGLEAGRSIRDGAFSNLTDGNHGLSSLSGIWNFSGTSDIDEIFTRQIAISTIDANTKQIVSNVSWQQNLQRTGQVSLTTRLTNWSRSTTGSWALPGLQAGFDLTAANSGNAAANAISIAYANQKVYLGRTNSAGREFYIFDVANPAVPALLGQRNLNGNPNHIVVVGNYAYIASSDNNSELQIVDISDPATIGNAGKLTTVDLTVANSGNATADAIALATDGSYLYMTRNGGNGLLIFDIQANPVNPGNPVGRTASATGVLNDIEVAGNYAYAASTDNNAEVQVFNVTNKTAPTRVGILNLNNGDNNTNGLSIVYNNNSVFLGRTLSTFAPEFYVINVANPLTPTLTSTLEVNNSSVISISYDSVNHLAFMATTDVSNYFKVIDTNNLATPTIYGQLNLGPRPRQVIYAPDLDRVFIASMLNTQELQVIRPQ